MRSWCHRPVNLALCCRTGFSLRLRVCSLPDAAFIPRRLHCHDCIHAVTLALVRTLHFMSELHFYEGIGAGSRY